MGIAKRKAGFNKSNRTSDRLRSVLAPVAKKADKRGNDFSQMRELVLKRDDYTCQRCGASNHPNQPTDVVLTVHHIVGIAAGGLNMMTNLITLCNHCHAGVAGSANRRGGKLLKTLKRSLHSITRG